MDGTLADMELSSVERAIVADLSSNGDNVPGNIADNTGHHPKSISRSLRNLEEKSIVENKGRGVWTLTRTGEELADHVLEWQSKFGQKSES